MTNARKSALADSVPTPSAVSSSNIVAESNRLRGWHIIGWKPSASSAADVSRIFLRSNCGPWFVSRYTARSL